MSDQKSDESSEGGFDAKRAAKYAGAALGGAALGGPGGAVTGVGIVYGAEKLAESRRKDENDSDE